MNKTALPRVGRNGSGLERLHRENDIELGLEGQVQLIDNREKRQDTEHLKAGKHHGVKILTTSREPPKPVLAGYH